MIFCQKMHCTGICVVTCVNCCCFVFSIIRNLRRLLRWSVIWRYCRSGLSSRDRLRATVSSLKSPLYACFSAKLSIFIRLCLIRRYTNNNNNLSSMIAYFLGGSKCSYLISLSYNLSVLFIWLPQICQYIIIIITHFYDTNSNSDLVSALVVCQCRHFIWVLAFGISVIIKSRFGVSVSVWLNIAISVSVFGIFPCQRNSL